MPASHSSCEGPPAAGQPQQVMSGVLARHTEQARQPPAPHPEQPGEGGEQRESAVLLFWV